MHSRAMKLTAVLFVALFASLGLLAQSGDEQEYEKWMKQTGSTMGALRKSVEAKQAEEVAAGAATLAEIFKKSEQFWAGRQKEDGVEWSKKSAAAAAEVEAAAKAGDFEKVGAGMKSLFGNCSACHTAFREKLPDGSYRFKQ
jgi:cytochrome c556